MTAFLAAMTPNISLHFAGGRVCGVGEIIQEGAEWAAMAELSIGAAPVGLVEWV